MSLYSADGPILVIIRGIPGSGKSFLAKKLTDSLPVGSYEILDPDAVDQDGAEFRELSRSLSDEGVDARFHLYRYSRGKAFAAIESKKLLIWNQPFVDFDGLHKTIEKLQAYAVENGLQLPVLIVEVELDGETAKQRIDIRKSQNGHGPDADGLARFINDYKTFAGQGYPTVTVQGGGDINDAVSSIGRALTDLT